MALQDEIGSRGEFIFCARIMDFCDRPLPYFRPHFLGEKAHTLDFWVELVGTDDRTLYFFAQVKTTRKALTRRGRRLRIELPDADLRRAARVPAPTYLVGIDERAETAYLLAVLAGMSGDLASIPTTFPLDRTNLPLLFAEVERYWSERDMTRRASVFSERELP